MTRVFVLIVAGCLMCAAAPAADAAPPPLARTVSYSKDVKPLLEQRCHKCHGKDKPEGDLDMRTRESFLKGGEDGVVIVVGKSTESEVIKRVTSKEKDRMPRKGDPLTAAEISILRAWIDQGFKWDDGAAAEPVKK